MHSGRMGRVQVLPAPFGAGLTVRQGGREVPVDLAHAAAVPGCTQLLLGGRVLATPEHLLAALAGLGVTDAVLEVEGDEVPVLDGSAAPWCEAIRAAGRVEGPALRPRGLGVGEVEAHGGRMRWGPGPCEVVVHVDFGGDGPRGSARWRPGVDDFVEAVAWARTFVRAAEVEALRSAGRGRGATAENTLVWGEGTPRRPDEPVVHKLLDLVGDLALLGPWQGRVEVWRGSHRLHHAGMSVILGVERS